MCVTSCFGWWSRLLGESERMPSHRAALSRRHFLAGVAAPFLGAGCATAGPPASPAARSLLEKTVSIDLHSHPSLFPGLASDSMAGHRRQAEAGGIRILTLAAVADAVLLGRTPRGGLEARRDPSPGELFASTWRQLDVLTSRSQEVGMRTLGSAEDVTGTDPTTVNSLLAVEGCDFLEGRLERLQQAYERGVRSLQLVHYRVNELGDIQTEAPRHGGLTDFGRQAVRELNRLGIVVDVAHATFSVVKGVVETTSQPIVLSHSNIQDASGWARFITVEHARLVAGTGGVIGAMPIVFGNRGDNIAGYVNHVSRLVDAVGMDHVGIGTDMDGIGPGAVFTSYGRWPSLTAALLDRGYRPDDVGKILGGNFQRVFAKVRAGAKAS
jgi:membrane dipeptidase